MDTIAYGSFSLGLHSQTVLKRIPLSGTIEITNRCPLTCAHCLNNLPMGDSAARSRELSLKEHCRILDEIADAGCLWLLFTGGEIFARRDFLDIYTYAKKKGLLITLFTNGTMITPKIADYLVEWPPFRIEITLYGRTRETYERLTGIPGSFDLCMRGIELLRERRLPLELKTVAVTLNQFEVWDMMRFAEGLGLRFKFDSMMNPRIDCSQSPLSVRLNPAEVVQLDMLDPKRVAAWKEFASQFNGPVHRPEEADEEYHCGGGISSFAVDPEGKLSICILSHVDTYDLRTGSFREGWDEFLKKVRGRKITRITKCVTCEIKAMCGMCSANAELETGDPESPVDFLCHVAHLRAHSLDLQVPRHGACEYCEGGGAYPELMRSLERLRASGSPSLSEYDAEAEIAKLPVTEQQSVSPECSFAGFSSCGSGTGLPQEGAARGSEPPEPTAV